MLRLTKRVGGPVEIETENLEAIEGQSDALLHPDAGKSHDLRQKETVTIEPEGQTTTLKVAVGNKSYVEG